MSAQDAGLRVEGVLRRMVGVEDKLDDPIGRGVEENVQAEGEVVVEEI